jgi:serine/threonine-protein kinase
MEVVAHHLKTPAPAPSSVVPQPPELDDLVLRLLAKEPQQRPASASEVARELRALLQPQGSSTVSAPRTISRPIPAVKPATDSAPVNAPTATLSPAPITPGLATPGPGQGAPLQPPTRGPRRTWAIAMGGALTLALGVGVLVSRGPAEPVPAAAPPPPVTATPIATQPAASTPEPQPPPAPAPTLAEAPKPAVTSPSLAKKKQPRPVQQPVATAVRVPLPAAPEPAPAPEREPARNATGTLHLLVKGAWADVWIDGQKLGRVPPQNRYPLTAGEHSLELRNPNRAPYQQRIVIPANDTLPHTVDFTATAQGSAASP